MLDDNDGMKISAYLRPAHAFRTSAEPVVLREGVAAISIDGERLLGAGQVRMRMQPAPSIVIRADVPAEQGLGFTFILDSSMDASLCFEGREIKGFVGQRRFSEDRLTVEWHPARLPLVLDDMEALTSVVVSFHLFNFIDVRGGCRSGASEDLGVSQLLLDAEEWRLVISALPESGTDHAWTRIREEGGCHLTHVGRMERRDGGAFSGSEAEEQLHLLANFLSFVRGERCFPVCEVGFDEKGEKTWESFDAPALSYPPATWLHRFEGKQLESLFPLFAQRWQQSAAWRDCLRAAIYWYNQANTSGVSPAIDAAIILAQSALERLAHHYLVVDRKMISSSGLDKLAASDRLRLLCANLGIPLALTQETPSICKAAEGFRWVDWPHALTDIRNELVHPVSKKKVNACTFDAWRLSLWYVELCILAMCGYQGRYVSRLDVDSGWHSETVPWARPEAS